MSSYFDVFHCVASWDQNERFKAFSCFYPEGEKFMLEVFSEMYSEPNTLIPQGKVLPKLKSQEFPGCFDSWQGSTINDLFFKALMYLKQAAGTRHVDGQENTQVPFFDRLDHQSWESMPLLVGQFYDLKLKLGGNEKLGILLKQFEEKLPKLTTRKISAMNHLLDDFHSGHKDLRHLLGYMAVHLEVRIAFDDYEQEIKSYINLHPISEASVTLYQPDREVARPVPIIERKAKHVEVARDERKDLGPPEDLFRVLIGMARKGLATIEREERKFKIKLDQEMYKVHFLDLAEKRIKISYFRSNQDGLFVEMGLTGSQGEVRSPIFNLGSVEYDALFQDFCQQCKIGDDEASFEENPDPGTPLTQLRHAARGLDDLDDWAEILGDS